MPRCSQRVVPLTGDPQGIPTNTPDQFPAQDEGLGGPCGTRGTPTPYGAIRASKNAQQDHLNVAVLYNEQAHASHARAAADFMYTIL